MSGVPGRIEDVGKRPGKLRNASKRVRERKGRNDSPGRTPEEPEDPGGETLVQGGVRSEQEGPEGVRNEHVDGMNAPTRVIGRGRVLEVQEESKGAKVDRDHRKVLEGAGCDRKRPKTKENPRDVETNAQSRDRGPGGHIRKKKPHQVVLHSQHCTSSTCCLPPCTYTI